MNIIFVVCELQDRQLIEPSICSTTTVILVRRIFEMKPNLFCRIATYLLIGIVFAVQMVSAMPNAIDGLPIYLYHFGESAGLPPTSGEKGNVSD